MINVLEFSMSSEYKFAWNVSARSLFHIFENLTDCMILYRYKLAERDYIFRKFGASNPDKIVFDKLDGKNLILFHLDVYKESTNKFRELLEYCLQNNIDIYIPIHQISSSKGSTSSNQIHIESINDILDDYDVNRYNFKDISYNKTSEIQNSIIEVTKPLIREINLRKLLD